MKFDNSKTIISLRIKLFAATVIFLAYIVLAYIAKLIKFPLLGMSDTTWTLILVAIYLIIAFLPMILNYQYVYYSDDSEKIIFRYFTAGIVGGRKNTVEIHKRTLSSYQIESELFGLRQKITLYQRLNEGVAKYPPFYISALSKDERAKLVRSLDLYTTPE